MGERLLFLISANKSRRGNLEWSDDDYDVRDGAPDGPVVGRIYKLSVALAQGIQRRGWEHPWIERS